MARKFIAASSQKIDFGDNDAMDGASTLTVSAWMKRTATGNLVTVNKYSASNFQIYMILYTDGNCYTLVRNNSNANYWFTANNDTNWHHIVMVFDGGLSGDARQKTFIDGVEEAGTYVDTPPATTPDVASPLVAGLWDGTTYSDGSISRIKVWSSALTADQVLSDYYGKTPLPESLLQDSPLGYGSPEPDYSGEGNNGTLTNSPTITDAPPVIAPWGADEDSGIFETISSTILSPYYYQLMG